MNEVDFNERLQEIAKDLRLLHHPQRRLWGIYQIRRSTLIVPGSSDAARPWLLFDITNEDGSFRLPDQRDLKRAMISSYSGQQMWKMGGDKYNAKIEEQEKVRDDAHKAKQDDLFRQVAKDVSYHTKVVKNRGR